MWRFRSACALDRAARRLEGDQAASSSPRVRTVAAVLLVLLVGGVLHAEDDAQSAEPTQAELKERAGRIKKDESEYRAAVAKAEAEHAAELEALGIVGVTPLGVQGDPSRSLDLVIMGDGFTKEEQAEYQKVVDRMAQNFDTPPFDAYGTSLNLYRVDLVSPESGISLEGAPVNTPLGGNVRPFVGGKLLACNVEESVSLARAAVPKIDYLMVVLNTHGKFLGSANSGAIFLLSTSGGHQRSIVVHEFGHNFGGLLDEYVDEKQARGRNPSPQLKQIRNVGLESNVHAAKWHYWNIPEAVFRGTKRGKPFDVEDNVRCYEGAATFPDDVYRPEESCHMQRGRGKAFCRACVEGLEIALCRFFEPIDAVTPPVERVALGPKEAMAFTIRPVFMNGKADETTVRWYLDGRRLKDKESKTVEAKDGGGPRYVLETKGSAFGEGVHHLTATVEFLTPRVRMDLGRQSASYTWTIDVASETPKFDLPKSVSGDVDVPLEFTAKSKTGAEGKAWTLLHAPEGTTYDGASGLVAWTPTEEQHGAWVFAFARDAGSSILTVPARTRLADRRRNKPPKPVFLAPQRVRSGERLAFMLYAWDPDGDHLAWSADVLPDGSALDPNTGVFTWDVLLSQTGSHTLVFECTDGWKRLEVEVPVQIEGVPAFRGVFRIEPPDPLLCEAWVDRMLVGLHHPLPQVRLANAKALHDAPPTARLAEALRLWREEQPQLAAWARETLEGLFDQAPDARLAHLDLFLDVLPVRVWQFADRPDDRAFLGTLIAKALATDGVSKDQRRALEALELDLDVIEAYGEDRLAKKPVPPITDKKYR